MQHTSEVPTVHIKQTKTKPKEGPRIRPRTDKHGAVNGHGLLCPTIWNLVRNKNTTANNVSLRVDGAFGATRHVCSENKMAQLIMKDCLQPSHIHTSLRKELHLFAMECLHHGQKRGKIAAQCNANDNPFRRLCRSRSCLRRCGSRCRQSCIYAGAGIAGLLPCCAVFGHP